METPIIVEPKESANSAVIWLHGLGATKQDFLPVAEILQARVLPNTRFILPQAPVRPVSLNNGFPMPSWYDIIALTSPREIKQSELDESSQYVISLIEAQIAAGIPLDRIILAGFSQGGAVVLHTAFIAHDKPVGGVMALSTYSATFDESLTIGDNKIGIPTLHLHGTLDPVVKLELGIAAEEFLRTRGVQTTWHDYRMEHEVINEELQDIAAWLVDLLGPKDSSQ